MRRIFAVIGCLTVFLTAGFAQESGNSQVQVLDGGWDLPKEKEKIERIGNDVRDLEAEVSVGYLCGSRIYGGARLSAELRYNIKNTGLDLGLQYSSMGGDLRDKKNSTGDRRSFTIQGMYGFFIDCNWRVWNNIAPFAGIGVGYFNGYQLSRIYYDGAYSGITVSSDNAFLAPRAGCEFFDHLRVGVEYRLNAGRSPSFFSITLGWAFSGGHRK